MTGFEAQVPQSHVLDSTAAFYFAFVTQAWSKGSSHATDFDPQHWLDHPVNGLASNSFPVALVFFPFLLSFLLSFVAQRHDSYLSAYFAV